MSDAEAPARPARLQVYEDGQGEWRWRVRAGNNRIVADSAEGYVNRHGAMRAAEALLGLLAHGPLQIEVG
jgi:uncharacterized protein YegP (UPF0339 family)